jgi:HEAT repeat protein
MRNGKASLPMLLALTVSCLSPGAPARADEEGLKADIALVQRELGNTDGPALMAFFRQRTPTDQDRQTMEQLIRKLGSSKYADRRNATAALIAKGPAAVPLLKAAMTDPDQEIRDRARQCFEKITGGPGPELPAAAARLLVVRNPAGAALALLKYAPYADDEWLEEEVLDCLGKLAIHGGKVDSVLSSALKDALPARRAAAGYLLGKMGDLDQRLAVRQLLGDPDPTVRTRVAVGLVGKEVYQAVKDSAQADEELLKHEKIATDAAGLLGFFRSRTLSEQDQETLHRMVRQWGSPSYKLRQKAWQHVLSKGTSALPFLEAARSNPDPEIRDRADKAIALIRTGPGPALPTAAARLLLRKAPPDALETLIAYIPFADDDSVEEELLNVLCALTTRDVRMPPALFSALRDELPARRGAAANVLARVGAADDLRLAARLLHDSDPRVKLRAAQGMLAAQVKDALPVLVDLLAKASSPAICLQIEEALNRVAGDSAPATSVGDGSNAGRAAAAREWAKWLEKFGTRVDLARAVRGQGYLGLRVISEFDWNGRFNGGKVWACGRDGKERWKIENLLGPMDAHLLPNGNVLVAENNGRMVRELNRQGKEVWKKPINGNPVSCQRLANGNTFIACYYNILEVDKNGSELYNVNRGFNSYIFSARKMRNGNIVAMTSMGTIVELENKTGRELRSIAVPSLGNWCSVEELRNGRYLVALMSQNKVVEVDSSGKTLKEFPVVGVHTATRLPNGNTLVAGMNNRYVAEFNGAGKEVWRKTTEGRPWRINFR